MHLCNLTFLRFAMGSFKLKSVGGKLGRMPRQNFAQHSQAWIHTGFHCFTEIGQIFHNWEIERWNNPPICKASFEENGTGQYPVWITQKPKKVDFRELKSQKFSGETCPQTLAPRWGDRSVCILDTRLILYTRFNVFNKASSTRIRICFKMKTFPPVWLPVHTYSLKTVGENASFQKRSPEWRFFKCLFAVLMWMNYC